MKEVSHPRRRNELQCRGPVLPTGTDIIYELFITRPRGAIPTKFPETDYYSFSHLYRERF